MGWISHRTPEEFVARVIMHDLEVLAMNVISANIGDLHVTNTLIVDGRSDYDGDVYYHASVYQVEDVVVLQDFQIGNAATDTLILNSKVLGDIIPTTDGLRDIGSIAFKWDELYVEDAYVNVLHSNLNNHLVLQPVATYTVQLNTTGNKGAAAAGNRGGLFFEAGGGGARDRFYMSMKSDAGVYNWVEISNGGP